MAQSDAKNLLETMLVGVLAVRAKLTAQRNIAGKIGVIEVVPNHLYQFPDRFEGNDLAADLEVLRQHGD
jgi:hypothetical protein